MRLRFCIALAAATILGCAQGSAGRRDETGQALREETGPHETVTGRVAAVDTYRNVVVIDAAKGRRIRLRLSRSTVISLNGAPAAMADVREGVPIRAAYHNHLGEHIALVVDVSQQDPNPIPHSDRSREGTGGNNVRSPGGAGPSSEGTAP